MKTLIAYGTKHGCTEKCAEILSEKLTDKVDMINLKKVNSIDLQQYDKVIIGGSIYIGKIQKEVSEFCLNNMNSLTQKKLGLFICGMREGDIAETELKNAFPEELIAQAISKEYFGGEFIFKKMNFMERLIVKKVSKIDKDTSNISTERIDSLAKVMNIA